MKLVERLKSIQTKVENVNLKQIRIIPEATCYVNECWKQNVKIGKSNNQKFVSIQFLKLIQQIKYKAELVGIVVQTVNESHTYKCDSFSLESIKHHDKYKGKRKEQGLFQSSINNLVNADVNGAINILRRVISNSFIDNRYRLSATQPVTVNPL